MVESTQRRRQLPHWSRIHNLYYIIRNTTQVNMSHLLLLGKFEYGGGSIFKVVLEC